MSALVSRPHFRKKNLSEPPFSTSERGKRFLRHTRTSIGTHPGSLRKLEKKFSSAVILILIRPPIYSFSSGSSSPFSGGLVTVFFALKVFSDFAPIFPRYFHFIISAFVSNFPVIRFHIHSSMLR